MPIPIHSKWNQLVDLDDASLIQQLVGKNSGALAVLYDRYGRLVYSLVYRVVNDPSTAEEVTQDVFLQLWHKAWMYRPEQGKLVSWLTRIARNKAIDVFRHNKGQPETLGNAWDDGESDEHTNGLIVEDVIEIHIQSARIKKAISTLPADQRYCLSLAFFGGLSHQEIAEQIGEPLGTIKTRIRLAMIKLRVILTETV
jgi:RNA polymerase sigma-70 factor (ECF subfamily)